MTYNYQDCDFSRLFIVKKLNRAGKWDSVSLIDENGSFRGEARFESRSLADQYIRLYKDRKISESVLDVRSLIYQ